MAMVTCPQCRLATSQAGYPAWVIIVCVVFFPFGLLALLNGRLPTTCTNCGNSFQV